MMRLLGQMVDSNLASPKDYQPYFSKFLIEAKQELKKQAIAEKNKAIKKAEAVKDDKTTSYINTEDKDYGNDDLSLYATLLLPFAETNPAVKPLIQQMLRSNDKQLKYNTMLLLLRNHQAIPDSLPGFFGSLDDYRYELYKDLRDLKLLGRFPARFNNHRDLGKSKLLGERSYDKPDSIVYVDRLPAEVKGKKGFIYFYKYKSKKDDPVWKLATVGLVPQDSTRFEFEAAIGSYDPDDEESSSFNSRQGEAYRLNYTRFTDKKIKEDEPIRGQLKQALKRALYSKRKSAKQFYSSESDSDSDASAKLDFGD
jgi:hypothetical protein